MAHGFALSFAESRALLRRPTDLVRGERPAARRCDVGAPSPGREIVRELRLPPQEDGGRPQRAALGRAGELDFHTPTAVLCTAVIAARSTTVQKSTVVRKHAGNANTPPRAPTLSDSGRKNSKVAAGSPTGQVEAPITVAQRAPRLSTAVEISIHSLRLASGRFSTGTPACFGALGCVGAGCCSRRKTSGHRRLVAAPPKVGPSSIVS
jgi:hypothetical protein